MNWISTLLTIVATSFLVLPIPSARGETEGEMIARGRYIATAIQGCGYHTREKPDGSKDENWHYAGSPNPAQPAGPPANAGWSSPAGRKFMRVTSRPINGRTMNPSDVASFESRLI
jgi:hypothetical protein